ncbi:MAG: DUF523 domain-containing protein [Candidatus Izemoplasmatales bacterium]|jgi:uncharacterized protein YbbK (DUF523 family)|nr:DUF523 domain-containing protein [Candidatus Izemoplasmatales bacterium]
MEHVIAVSACLLGYHCKYNGGHNLDIVVVEKVKGMKVIPICPETLGGMETPRIPSEIASDGVTVMNQKGEDTTLYFERGKKASLLLLQSEGCTKAILKDGSPSCGTTTISDGTFSKTKIPGEGITCKYLRANGIKIIDVTEEGEL